MKVEECIKRFDGLVIPYWCELYKNFINSRDKKLLGVGNNKIVKDVRNVEGFSIHHNHFPEINNLPKKEKIKYVPLMLMYHSIAKRLEVPLLNYQTMFRNTFDFNLIQVDFLKYSVDGKYEVHADQGIDSKDRLLTAIINLNEDYEGGDFEFYDPRNNKDVLVKENLKQGSVLLFPSNFVYPHSVKPLTKGERYSLVCWLG